MFTLILLLCLPNSFSGCHKWEMPPNNIIVIQEHMTKKECQEAIEQQEKDNKKYLVCAEEI